MFLSLLLKMEGFFTFVAVFDGSECDGGYDDVFNHTFLKYIFLKHVIKNIIILHSHI